MNSSNEDLKNAKSFDELLRLKYGSIGTLERDEHEVKANYFVISQMLKEAREEANITQEELAAR